MILFWLDIAFKKTICNDFLYIERLLVYQTKVVALVEVLEMLITIPFLINLLYLTNICMQQLRNKNMGLLSTYNS